MQCFNGPRQLFISMRPAPNICITVDGNVYNSQFVLQIFCEFCKILHYLYVNLTATVIAYQLTGTPGTEQSNHQSVLVT